jgi:hypothetical protein
MTEHGKPQRLPCSVFYNLAGFPTIRCVMEGSTMNQHEVVSILADEKPINICRGEGGEEWLGVPSWSSG